MNQTAQNKKVVVDCIGRTISFSKYLLLANAIDSTVIAGTHVRFLCADSHNFDKNQIYTKSAIERFF